MGGKSTTTWKTWGSLWMREEQKARGRGHKECGRKADGNTSNEDTGCSSITNSDEALEECRLDETVTYRMWIHFEKAHSERKYTKHRFWAEKHGEQTQGNVGREWREMINVVKLCYQIDIVIRTNRHSPRPACVRSESSWAVIRLHHAILLSVGTDDWELSEPFVCKNLYSPERCLNKKNSVVNVKSRKYCIGQDKTSVKLYTNPLSAFLAKEEKLAPILCHVNDKQFLW